MRASRRRWATSSCPALGSHQVPAAPAWGAGIPLLLLASHQPSTVPQAGGDATGSKARGPGVFRAPPCACGSVRRRAGARDSALSSPCLSSQDLKFNSISKEINFKVAFYARVVCALPGQRCMSRPLSRWTRSVPPPQRGGLAGSPSFGVQGCVLLSVRSQLRGGKVRPGCPGCELKVRPVGRLL